MTPAACSRCHPRRTRARQHRPGPYLIWESRNVHSIMRSQPVSARIPCQAAASFICRSWRPCAPAACWSSSQRTGAGSSFRSSVSNSIPLPPWRQSRSNATKYTPAGSRIVIAAEASGVSLEVTVYDNDPGLPVGRETEVFDKFTRGERESATPGVGLGLAICRAIVEAHRGSIRAGTSPEGGAAIVFTLPIEPPPPLPEPEETDQNQMSDLS